MEFQYKDEYSLLTRVCLNLTDSCNLACKYCFVEQNPHYMSYDIAKQAVDYIVKNRELKGTSENCFLNFFGGEPTLMWDEIIVPLTNYIKQNKLPINLAMTTNGTLLDEKKVRFLHNNHINILLSIDGDEFTQNYNRPCRSESLNSFDLVKKNIPFILKDLPKTTFRSTIYAPTAKNSYENFLFAGQLGFKSIYFGVDERHSWTEAEIKDFYLAIDKIFSFYDYCFENELTPPIDFRQMTKMFRTILKVNTTPYNIKDIPHNILRCGLGTTLGSIGYDGKIYGCQEQTSKIDKNIFLIGDIFTGIDKEKHANLLKTYYEGQEPVCKNKNLCKNCIRFCEGNTCPSTNLDMENNFFIRSEIVCLFDKHVYQNCLILLHKYAHKKSKSFYQYLNNSCSYQIEGV